MIRHLFRLVWARKRSNLLLILEIFISFIVLFAVFTMGLGTLQRLHAPIGFEYEDVYRISIDKQELSDSRWIVDDTETVHRIVRELEAMPEVLLVAGCYMPPYSIGGLSSTTVKTDSIANDIVISVTYMSDDAAKVLGMNLLAGRWFEEADDALEYAPIVITSDLAEQLFPGEDAVGKSLYEPGNSKVVGVVGPYRKDGELAAQGPHLFERISFTSGPYRPVRNLVMKVAPGTSAQMEEKAITLMRRIEPGWTYRIAPLLEDRATANRTNMVPFVIVALIGTFMLLMVVLGMVGVLWQSITRRTDEIGLRRALGSPRDIVYRQILGEIVIVTLFGSILAILLLLQLPLLGILGNIGWQTITSALVLSLLCMILLAMVSGLYPAWLAARVQPAQALHYE